MPTRYAIQNGVALCPRCHKFGIGYAAHENPLWMAAWLTTHRPDDLKWLVENHCKSIPVNILNLYKKEEVE